MALFSTNHTLAQGSLHYRLATLGYQKQKAMGFVNLQISFAPIFLLKWLSKAEGDGVRQSANFLCAALPFERAIKSIPQWGSSICKHPLRRSSF